VGLQPNYNLLYRTQAACTHVHHSHLIRHCVACAGDEEQEIFMTSWVIGSDTPRFLDKIPHASGCKPRHQISADHRKSLRQRGVQKSTWRHPSHLVGACETHLKIDSTDLASASSAATLGCRLQGLSHCSTEPHWLVLFGPRAGARPNHSMQPAEE